VPSEARKRGSGGGSPRKCDDLLTGLSGLSTLSVRLTQFDWQRVHGVNSATYRDLGGGRGGNKIYS
jgi:hypothetical protein